MVGIDVSPRMVEQAELRCGDRARFLVADLAEPLPIEPGSLDGVTCSLALHYVRDWSVPLRSFATALKPGGRVVLSLDHPFGRPAGIRGGYFDAELVGDTWRKDDIEVTQHFWRRPLAPPWTTSPTRGSSSIGSSSRSRRRRRWPGFPTN